YRNDVALLRDLGIGAYRLSFGWSRLQPTGTGQLNPAGVDFYDRLLDQLLAAEIQPFVTLYHWDLPQVLEDAGGWPTRDTANRFADYATAAHARFADRVADWTTLNEPWVAAFLGYAAGVHAPGRAEPAAAVLAAHHLLLGHGIATAAMRAARRDLRYGITLNLHPIDAASSAARDVEAARRVDGVQNRLFLDPLLRGHYPADVLADLAPVVGPDYIRNGDEATINAPLDFLGVNYYFRQTVRGGRSGEAASDSVGQLAWVGADDVVPVDAGHERTEMGWEIDPTGLRDVLVRLATEYGSPILYVTENGAAFDDEVSADGAVHDARRTAYLDGHLRAARAAIQEGADLRGYFVWSFMDNFEWAFGYSKRFGIVYVDYPTQVRTIKDSGRWFSRVARSNRLPAWRDVGTA
ncbi:MAG: beta-glucosidase, partial [Chloroflexota bacterium]|nr:beta-glucosidase [Chloroflexota bacterium]